MVDRNPDPAGADPPPGPEPLDLDRAALRAVAHPLRVRLYHLLSQEPSTASKLGVATGESSGSTSYHLRQLARHGLIEEAPELGTARERWWRARPGGVRIQGNRYLQDPETRPDAELVLGELYQRWVEDLMTWPERSTTWPVEWTTASQDTWSTAVVTHEELAELTRSVGDLIRNLSERSAARQEADAARAGGEERRVDDDPVPERARVHIQFHAFPAERGPLDPSA